MKKRIIRLLQIRTKEPSTWAGLAALGLVLGLPAGTIDTAGQIMAGLAGLAAIILPEEHDAGQ
jgi:hypothetical protein